MSAVRAWSRPRILVVDDEDDIRSLIREVLEERGFDIIEAVNGKEAMALIRDFRPELIILDLVMPEMEGIEVIRAVRRSGAKTRIVAISGAASGAYLRPAGYLGADMMVKKPFPPVFLADRVEELLRSDDKQK
jgi:DNA-binding response OmpR family regulator